VLSRTNPPRTTAANSFRFRSYGNSPILHYFGANKSFRIRSYREGSRKSFRIRSYKNTGGGGTPTLPRIQPPASSIQPPKPSAPRGASISRALTRLRILPVATGLPAVVGVYYPLRALLRCTEAQKCPSVSPLLATLTHSLSRKSFPCHSYANTRDGGVTMPFQFFPSALCFSVPARRRAGGPLPAPRLGRGGKSLFSSSLPYLFRYVSTPELLLPSIHSANITKVQTRGAAGVAGSRADKPWQP